MILVITTTLMRVNCEILNGDKKSQNQKFQKFLPQSEEVSLGNKTSTIKSVAIIQIESRFLLSEQVI